jgi:threonyl-tRNA synthetase
VSRLNLIPKDGSPFEVEEGTPAGEFLDRLGDGNRTLGVKVNGKVFDLLTPLRESGEIEPIRPGTPEGYHLLRHTSAHVMAQAVQRLFGDVEFAIGPTIEDGFYYDFDLEHTFTPDDLPRIEEEMRKIMKENLPVTRVEVESKDEARKVLSGQRAKFKREIVDDLPDDARISFYSQGEFTDLCRGPHLPSTGRIPSVRLLSIAGAYWRGLETREMLQRIYGTAWFSEKELREYLKRLEEARKRDHRKLGKQLDLFSFHGEAPGMPFWHPNGMVLYDEIIRYWQHVHREAGYVEIQTPLILNNQLWRQSGHWDHYKENMYFTEIDESEYAVKPMNCPGGTLVYSNDLRSYRDLPIKMAERGLVHRHEKSGVLNGLFRVRCFTQDDAHVYCTPEQLEDEVGKVIDLVFRIYGEFGFEDFAIELSTRPSKSIGSDEMWENAERSLAKALETKGIEHDVAEGEGAFYGPKIDFHIRDVLKRSWQCGTIQVDFSMPERFDLTYVGVDGAKHRPVMIHRAVLGSFERFIGILIEHYGGAFPTWLAPEQARVVPVSEEKHGSYAKGVAEELRAAGIRAREDLRNLRMGKKIREAQVQKIPYALVVGENEMEQGGVAVRRRDGRDLGPMARHDFIEKIEREIRSRSLDLTVEKD